jgi:uncharacterized protein
MSRIVIRAFHVAGIFLIAAFKVPFTLKAGQEAPGDNNQAPAGKILEGARREVARQTRYVEEYHVLTYPGGDVPAGTGVCTDLIIRSFRNAGVD